MDKQKLLNYARILGAEARANQKASFMTADVKCQVFCMS